MLEEMAKRINFVPDSESGGCTEPALIHYVKRRKHKPKSSTATVFVMEFIDLWESMEEYREKQTEGSGVENSSGKGEQNVHSGPLSRKDALF